MDAVEFLKEKKRMCDYFEAQYDGSIWPCAKCMISARNNGYGLDCVDIVDEYPEEAVRIVEEWSKAHPVQTNAMKFEEVFGKPITTRFPKCLPWIGKCVDRECAECNKWWDEPYKEPEHE